MVNSRLYEDVCLTECKYQLLRYSLPQTPSYYFLNKRTKFTLDIINQIRPCHVPAYIWKSLIIIGASFDTCTVANPFDTCTVAKKFKWLQRFLNSTRVDIFYCFFSTALRNKIILQPLFLRKWIDKLKFCIIFWQFWCKPKKKFLLWNNRSHILNVIREKNTCLARKD